MERKLVAAKFFFGDIRGKFFFLLPGNVKIMKKPFDLQSVELLKVQPARYMTHKKILLFLL